MTPDEKIAEVRRQITVIRDGDDSAMLHCPYCQQDTIPGEVLCCVNLAQTIESILDREEMASSLDNISSRLN